MSAVQQIEPRATGGVLFWPVSTSFDKNFSNTQTNAATVVVLDADTKRPCCIAGLSWSFSATPAAGGALLQIQDGSNNVLWQQTITASGPGSYNFPIPKAGPPNSALTVTLATPGVGGCISTLNVDVFKLA